MKLNLLTSNKGLTPCSSKENSQASRRNSKRENPKLFLEKIRSFLLPMFFLVLGTVGHSQTSAIASAAQINIGGLAKGTTQIVSQFQIVQTVSAGSLTQIVDVTTGTYTTSDISNFKLYGGTSTDFASATLLKTLTPTATGAGETLTFNSLTYSLTVATHYFWITADVASGATLGKTVVMSAISNTAFTFAAGSKSGSVTTSGTLTVAPATNTSFTTGNIVGLIATSNSSNNSSATIVELNTTTASQTPTLYNVGSLTGTNAVRISGSATSTAYLANTDDGTLLAIAAPNSSITSVNINTVQSKAVFTYAPDGAFSRATTYTGTGTNQVRGASSLNNTTWYIGDQGGFYSNTTSAASPTGNMRAVKAFGGVMYALTSLTTTPAVGIISAATGGTYTALTGLPNGTANMQDFSFISSGSNGSTYDVLYVLEASSGTVGTIYKYALISGTWTAKGTYLTTIGGFGLTAKSNGSGADIYMTTGTGATSANKINKLVDTAAWNATIAITGPTTLYTAPTGSTIKGVAFAPASNPSMAISSAHPAASTVNQGTADNIIGGFACAVTISTATLNAITVNTAGTYGATDLTNIKFWYNTSNSLTGATQLGATQTSVGGTGASVGVSGLTQSIYSGTTGYILVTATIDAAATLTNTISLASTAFSNITFAIGTKTGTNPVAASNSQTISVVPPTIALANGTIAAANSSQNTTNNVLYRADFTVGAVNATLTSASFTTAGTYSASDLSNLKLWYSTSATFSTGTATAIGTKTTGLGAGAQTFSSLSQIIAIGSGYLFLTADVSCFATITNTINVSATATGDFTFTLGSATGSGFTAGGSQTIIAATTTPSNVATNTSVGNGTAGQINAVWTAPSGCYNEIMVVASPIANTGGTPTGDGSLYNTPSLAYTSGTAFGNGYVMYKGTTAPQTLTGFTNGTNYFIKIFTRYNTTWSAGTEVSASAYTSTALTEVVIPQYMHSGGTNARVPSAYCVTLSGLTANATYRYNNQAISSTDSATTAGAGNIIFTGATQSANFVETGAPTLNTASTYGTFIADTSGNYTGWFITEPTTNARFNAGAQVFFRIRLNDGNNGTFVDRIATTTSSSTVLTMSTTAGGTNATAIRGTSSANAKDFVCLYDNTAGSGRPLSATFIEDDGNASVANFATFITSAVNGVAGAWGAVIPNALPNGLRRIETRSFTTGSVICSATDADGSWPTGPINTVSPTGGSTAIVIATADAGLNCSSVVLNHAGIAQTSASTENLNTNDNIISNFRVNTSTYATTLNSISFTIGGTFVAGNVANFKLYTSTSSSFPGGTALSTVAAATIANGDTVTFSSLAQACAVGDRYFWIAADFGFTGTTTTGNTIVVPALVNANFTFASNASITTNSISEGGVVTFGTVIPTIAVSSSTIAVANINDGTTNNVLYRADVAVSATSTTLNAISFTTTGTYVPADVTNFKLWYSTNPTFAIGTSTTLVSKTTSLGSGIHSFTGLTQTIPSGTTGYFYLTTDLPCSTTSGNTISVDAIAATDLTFALGTPTGSGTATATQTIALVTPVNVTGFTATATGVSQQVSVAFTLPTTCYDEIMIVAAPAANTASPTSDGSGYTASLTYGSGTGLGNGFVVYKGTTSPQLVSGLTNGTQYFFKIFTRNGTLWSVGTTDATATPVALPALTEVLLPQYIQGSSSRLPYAYRATLYNLLPSSTYRYFNQVVINSDAATTNGAGNVIFANSGGFSLSSGPTLATAGNYSTFTTDAAGSYTGWFITEPTSNARFDAGNTVNMRIMLNNGSTGTTVATRLTTTSGVKAINLGTTASDATGIRGTSYGSPKNFVMLYDNTAGTGRPVSGTYIESDGSTSSGYASFYTSSVNAVAGAWGTLIPNTLATGVRNIQEYSFTTGSAIGLTATDANGAWPSTVNTASPTSGTTPLVISTTDAPLEDIPTSSILSGTTAICNGTSADISIAITGGTSPYTVVYNDGTSNITVNGYVSDAAITVSPTGNTTYTLVSVTDAAGFIGIGNSGSAVVTVNPLPTATISGTVTTCLNTTPSITFTGANGSGVVQYEFTYKIGVSGTPAIITSTSGSSTATLVLAPIALVGAVNYILISVKDLNSGCSQAQAGTATVTAGICTQIRPTQCGQYLPITDTIIQASPVAGATQYSFEITLTTAPFTVIQFTWPNYYFNPTSVLGGGLAYGKEYSIRVKVFIGATEYSYGSACIVKAPLAPPTPAASTTVRPFQCGKTLAAINTFIEASPVVTATLYEFEVTDGSGTRFTTSTNYYFNPMTGLIGGVQYSTSYSIRVRTFTGVNKDIPLTPWGAACTVTTPVLPFSKLVTTQCNKTVTSLTPRLNAASIFLADGYRFRVRLQSNPLISRVVEKTSGNMTVLTAAELPGGYVAGTTYLVDVAVRYSVSGQWQESYGGDICTITTPIARMNVTQVDNIFNVKAFPNPFVSHFSLDIESSSDALVEMKVYDMIGRQLEVRKATVSELSVLEIGRNYPTGIYNVIVSQGQKVKSLRMTKR
ncbi:T9SS type A sorting domain-containing protein [Flavobacterium luteum]|uniref:T9SS type A sorting domain-containing protein n=1 Tax=Flavobacterium luteum TaxID=2026654 RepID=A0A7J5ABX6_9FLAO|nr:T9SS type A sorting domain-containing protein [Flavobacterium luteum]KAB1154938.1 T9SS type A sorting domain-containing protein [Flavobacterium luteum]